MKNKKILIAIAVPLIVMIVGIAIYLIAFKEDKNTTLTLLERQWIENNKSKLIDLSIVNSIPMLTYNGEGIFFDFLDDLEDATKLGFNKVAYNNGDVIRSDYSFKLVDKVGVNQILVYRDDYVLVTTNKKRFNSLDDINNLTVGVLSSDLNSANMYLNTNSTLLLKSFDSYDSMINDLTSTDSEQKKVDAIVLPRLMYFKDIVSNENLNIAYHISEMTQDYVLQLGSTERLNDILSKYYKKWSNESYDKSYQNQFLDSYLDFANVDDKKKVEFRSKRYSYGFVENSPYDYVQDGKYVGINHVFLANFSDVANVEIGYKKYQDIDSLVKDFNENKLDIIFNNTTYLKFNMNTINTISTFDEKIAVVINPSNKVIINSINSLKNYDVMAIKSSRLADTLVKIGVNVKAYDNMEKLLDHINKNSIIVIDYDSYNHYSSNVLKNYKVANIFNLGYDYTFTVRDTNENELFAELFDFYLSFNNEKELINDGYYEIIEFTSNPFSLRKFILSIIGVISAGILVLLGVKFIKPKKKVRKINLSKEDKLKYIDMLTSLKNRAYLNDNIEKWDASEVYPQTIIIIDLNNVAYINDNYGHAEGDKVIGEAANILIATQMPNSDIIRTNGNEFLIYMVEYDEKQIVNYIRKLNKDLKSLPHGFGAAIGYSMINDAIKTVDDAINEATAAMREIKEEIDY